MRIRVMSFAVAASLFAGSAYAACEIPSLVAEIPDGATATEQELLAVQAEVKAYVAAMDDYIACENESLSQNSANAAADYLLWMTTRIESAREEVDAVATRFNEQVEAFRATRRAATGVRQDIR